MRIGTKTLLFGGHQFILHPLLVGMAWVKIYHKLPNPKESICIIIHDWGYWGLNNIDGEEGDGHPVWAAEWASFSLDRNRNSNRYWELCMFHSRFVAKAYNCKPSKLCSADKLGITLYPTWLWYTLVRLSGELTEYQNNPKYASERELKIGNPREWFRQLKRAVPQWIKSGDMDSGKINTV